LRTSDGGKTWVEVPVPPAALSEGSTSGVRRIRFANLDDGWAFLPDLWATHDGGAHWTRLLGNAQILALETASGLVHALAGPDGERFQIQTAPVHTDTWRPSSTTVPAGAGPIPEAYLVLHGQAGWVVVVNRTVAGGARLEGGRWMPWQPPCRDAGGGIVLAASTSSDLAAFCDEGLWNDRPRAERVYLSADGGASFHQVPTPVPMGRLDGAASPKRSLFIVGGSDVNVDTRGVLMATFDAGRTWKTVDREGTGVHWTDLGFTSPSQGIVIAEDETQARRLLMSFDGGMTWRPVAFR
jgi:hypothetical protein